MSALAKVLLAHDFSQPAGAALAAALEVAQAFGAEVHVVHVLPRRLELLSPYELKLPEPLIREFQQEAHRKLEPILAELRAAGLRGESHLREGDPARRIADEAERLGADLIVMGTRGHTGLKHLLLGSVAERTHRIAPCPVLSVPAPEAA